MYFVRNVRSKDMVRKIKQNVELSQLKTNLEVRFDVLFGVNIQGKSKRYRELKNKAQALHNSLSAKYEDLGVTR